MYIRGVTAPIVGEVNPRILVTIQRSTGYTTAADGTQVPTYTTVANQLAQMQALTAPELTQVDAVSIEGIKQAMYLNGQWNGIVRASGKGGDIVILPDLSEWLIVLILENWPNWTKFALVRQLAAPA